MIVCLAYGNYTAKQSSTVYDFTAGSCMSEFIGEIRTLNERRIRYNQTGSSCDIVYAWSLTMKVHWQLIYIIW